MSRSPRWPAPHRSAVLRSGRGSDLRDHHRLRWVGAEPDAQQPLRQVGRPAGHRSTASTPRTRPRSARPARRSPPRRPQWRARSRPRRSSPRRSVASRTRSARQTCLGGTDVLAQLTVERGAYGEWVHARTGRPAAVRRDPVPVRSAWPPSRRRRSSQWGSGLVSAGPTRVAVSVTRTTSATRVGRSSVHCAQGGDMRVPSAVSA